MLVAAAALIAAPAGFQAQSSLPTRCRQINTTAISPIALVFVNGRCADVSQYITPVERGKIWSLQTPVLDLFGGRVQLTALYNADPFITFGVTSTLLIPGSVSYSFLFSTPVVPGFYTIATSTAGVSVANGARGTTTVSNSGFYPTYLSGYGTVGPAPTNLGVDLGSSPCVANGAPFTTTVTCNQGSGSNSFGPTFYDNLEAQLTFTQDDLGSVASWSGAVTLNATVVPEPAALALLTGGLVLLGGFAARRRGIFRT